MPAQTRRSSSATGARSALRGCVVERSEQRRILDELQQPGSGLARPSGSLLPALDRLMRDVEEARETRLAEVKAGADPPDFLNAIVWRWIGHDDTGDPKLSPPPAVFA